MHGVENHCAVLVGRHELGFRWERTLGDDQAKNGLARRAGQIRDIPQLKLIVIMFRGGGVSVSWCVHSGDQRTTCGMVLSLSRVGAGN